jgi:hypothetical protein
MDEPLLSEQLWPEPEWREVSRQLEQLSPDQLRRVVVTVARAAVSVAGADAPQLTATLDALGAGDATAADFERAADAAERYDEVAWKAEERGQDAEYALQFRRARAAAAVSEALGPKSRESVERVLYEALHALDADGAALFTAIAAGRS